VAWKEDIREQLDVSDSTVLTDKQKQMVKHWTDLQETLNAGDSVKRATRIRPVVS